MLIPYLTLQRKYRKKHFSLRNLGFGCSLTISILLFTLAISIVLGYMNLVEELPSLDSLPVLLDPQNGKLFQPTRLFDKTGNHIIFSLQNTAAVDAQYLVIDPNQPNHLPENLIYATLASLDPNFWDNKGYELAHINQPNIHPTLVQKFISEILLPEEKSGIKRSLRERLLAAQAIARYGKPQILEWFLNSTRYGPGIYGADAAAHVFYNKPAMLLSISESAYLSAIAENPQADPWDFPLSVLDRQSEIISEMQQQGWITQEEKIAALQDKINLIPESTIYNLSPTFSEYVLDQLKARFPNENFERGGWKITTTLDFDLQQQAECTLDISLPSKNSSLSQDENQNNFNCKAAHLLPSIFSQNNETRDNTDAAALILDPKNGQILAMVGDALTPHPGGTLLNPVVYLAAFSRGTNPGSLIWDIPDQQTTTNISDQTGIQYHGPVRVRTALVNDYVQPIKTLYNQLGENVIEVTANQLGLQIKRSSEPSLSAFNFLDNAQVSLMDITHTFALFSNQGIMSGQSIKLGVDTNSSRIVPASIIRVEDIHQAIWLDWSHPETQSVLTPQLSYLMNHILSDETARWPSLGHPNLLEIGRPVSAKIGNTASNLDYWTVGYTPQMVVGVWLGQTTFNGSNIPRTLSAAVWHALMQYSSQSKPVESWEPPPGINFVDVCDPSGLLPTAYCPTIVTEVFLAGGEPTQSDYLYQVFQVNRETERLATVFTPPELIEDKIYLVAPLEAAEWAEQAGLPAPPDAYDLIYTPPASENAQLTYPEMFSHVRGEVQFRGTADGNNLDYYRLQIGKGLNPQVWTQVSEDSAQSVKNGLLGTWDSTGQSGLFAVQLLVIGKDQRVDRAIMQITIDNEPPMLEIINPIMNQIIERKVQPNLVLNVQAHDNLEVGRVEFVMDNELLTTLTSAPFYISWPSILGDHTFSVKVYDLAGNVSESEIHFLIK